MYGRVVDVRDVAAAHVRAAEVGRSSSTRNTTLGRPPVPLGEGALFSSVVHCSRRANVVTQAGLPELDVPSGHFHVYVGH
jgi:hypothetical protein